LGHSPVPTVQSRSREEVGNFIFGNLTWDGSFYGHNRNLIHSAEIIARSKGAFLLLHAAADGQ
jgi:hypothetical protein